MSEYTIRKALENRISLAPYGLYVMQRLPELEVFTSIEGEDVTHLCYSIACRTTWKARDVHSVAQDAAMWIAGTEREILELMERYVAPHLIALAASACRYVVNQGEAFQRVPITLFREVLESFEKQQKEKNHERHHHRLS